MTHPSLEHNRNGLESTMRMVRETSNVGVGLVGMKSIEHEKRIEVAQGGLTNDALQADAGAIGRGHAEKCTFDPAPRDGDDSRRDPSVAAEQQGPCSEEELAAGDEHEGKYQPISSLCQCGSVFYVWAFGRGPQFALNRRTPFGTMRAGFVAVFVLGSR